MDKYPTKPQKTALSQLSAIGWKWNYETLKKDVIRCWSVDEAELEAKGFSTKLRYHIADIHSDGRVKMGEATRN